METHPTKREVLKASRSVMRWLLDSDPSIRWQVIRDLTDEPADVVATERAKVATEGWGARLLALQGEDGHWGGTDANPEWISILTLLWLEYLRSAGITPDARMAEAIDLVASRRDADGRWPMENVHAEQLVGRRLDAEEGAAEGRPSRWNTLRALRVLDWYS